MTGAWFATFITNAALQLLGFCTGIITARALGPEGRGALAALLFWPSLLSSIAQMSIDEALISRVARAEPQRASIVASAIALCVCNGALFWLLSVPSLPLVLGASRTGYYELVVLFAALWLPVTAVLSALLGNEQAAFRFGRANALRFIPQVTYLGALLVLSALDWVTPVTLMWSAGLGACFALVVHLWVARREVFARPSVREIQRLVKLGARLHVATLLILGSTQIDRMMVLIMFDNHDAGHYVVAWTFASAGTSLISSTASFVAFPAAAARKGVAEAIELIRCTLQRTTFLGVIAVGLGAVVVPFGLPMLCGNEFARAVPLALILLVASALSTVRLTAVRTIRAIGETWLGIVTEMLVITGVVAFAAIGEGKHLGLESLAAMTVVANAAALGVCAILLGRRYGVNPLSWLMVDFGVVKAEFRALVKGAAQFLGRRLGG